MSAPLEPKKSIKTTPRLFVNKKNVQPLATTQRMMTWLSMCPADESSNERQRKAYVVHTFAMFFIMVVGFIAGLVYYLEYFSIDFDGATFAFMTAVGTFGLIYFMITAILMRHQIKNIFTSMSTIYKIHESKISFWYLARANNKSEWMWKIYMKYIAVTLGGMLTTSLLSVFFCYLTKGNFNVNYVYRPTRSVLPWNQTTAAGYFGELSITISCGYVYLILNGIPLLLFISLCIHHQAFYKMFKLKISESRKCDAKLLCDLIRFHVAAKDLFLQSANFYSPFVLVQLICNTVMMTVSVFYLDLQWHDFDFIVASVIATTSIGITNLLFYCYFGKLASESYEMMSDRVYKMKWYKQPNKLQKKFILMIANMQKPVYYHGFNVAKLDLNTFIKLCNKIYSYYMVIKTLSAK